MRLFIAAELPQAVREALSETWAAVRDQVHGRWVAPDSFHVTLAFLGDVPGSEVPRVCEALHEACDGQPAIKVALGPLGSFGRAHHATLWQGFARGVDELGGLAGDVRECLAEVGLTYDPAAFVPHVTLMRNADLRAGELPMPAVESGLVEWVTLFSSDLSGDRPRYEAVERVHLRSWEDETEPEDSGEEAFLAPRTEAAEVDYDLLAAQVAALAEGETLRMPVLANATALVAETLPDVSWAGFYLDDGAGELVLGPFQGKVACMRIAWGRGVCGTAAACDATQLVPDVHAFPGHIACDSASRSEVVVPIHEDGRVTGVLDLDSTSLARFDTDDAAGLERVVAALEGVLPHLR